MLIEKVWGVYLSIDASLELEDYVLMFESYWTVVLRKFHVQWVVFWLRALAEGKGKVNLSGCPSSSSRH